MKYDYFAFTFDKLKQGKHYSWKSVLSEFYKNKLKDINNKLKE